MSLGAIVLIQSDDSDDFQSLEPAHDCAITEIRVEQHLNKQTTFAIRFQEDFDDKQAVDDAKDLFSKSQGIAICVADGEPPESGGPLPADLTCLVRGQIENSEFDISVGGSGSWFEIRGQDVRTLINRCNVPSQENGDTKTIIEALVKPISTNAPIVGEGIKAYEKDKISFNYRGTDLEAVYDLTKKSAYCFWLEYEVGRASKYPLRDPSFSVKATVHVEASPKRYTSQWPPSAEGFDGLQLLPGEKAHKFSILGDEDNCETVVSFSVSSDNEAPSSATSYNQNLAHATQGVTEDAKALDAAQNPDEDVTTKGGTDGESPGPAREDGDRCVTVGTSGEGDISPWLAFAAATEASWYIRADALTTAHMLQGIVKPHDIIEVDGGGCGVAGLYQATDVTHVINAAGHWMQVKLRSNSKNQPETLSI